MNAFGHSRVHLLNTPGLPFWKVTDHTWLCLGVALGGVGWGVHMGRRGIKPRLTACKENSPAHAKLLLWS